MKRTISIILVAALMLGLIAMTISVASAETIDTVAITGVTAPAVGQISSVEGIACSNPNISLEAYWQYLGGGQGGSIFNGIFENNRAYALVIRVQCPEEYEMDEATTVFTVNGQTPDYVQRYWGQMYDVVMIYELGQTQAIREVQFTALPEIKLGERFDFQELFAQIQLAEGLMLDENYNNFIIKETSDNYEYETQGIFEKAVYRLTLQVFASEPDAWLDTQNAGVSWPGGGDMNMQPDAGYVNVEYTVDLRDKLETIEIEGVKCPKGGETFTTEGIQLPEGLVPVSAQWYHADRDAPVEDNEVLVRDEEYRLEMEFATEEGYCIADDARISVNGMTEEDNYDFNIYGLWSDGFCVDLYHNVKSLQISSVQVKGLPKDIQPGAVPAVTPTVGHPNVTFISGRWVDEDMNPVTAFEAGKTYAYEVKAETKAGFIFTDWSAFYTREVYAMESYPEGKAMVGYFLYSLGKPVTPAITTSGMVVGGKVEDVKINVPEGTKVEYFSVFDIFGGGKAVTFEAGKRYTADIFLSAEDGYAFDLESMVTVDGDMPNRFNSDLKNVHFMLELNFGEKLDKVEVTVTEPKVGGDIAKSEPKVPDGANYVIGEWRFMDCATGEWYVNGSFRDGHKYMLYLWVEPEDGYYFDKDTTILINGAEPEDAYGSDTDFFGGQYYSFCDTLEKVELPAWPSIKAGDKLQTVPYTESDDGKYGYRGVWYDECGEVLPQDTEVLSGYMYTFEYEIFAEEGWDFDWDTQFLMDGKKIEEKYLYLTNQNQAGATKACPVGLELVDTVELTVEEPKIGEKAVVNVTIGDKVYYLGYAKWEKGKTEHFKDAAIMQEDEIFAYGYYYFLGIFLETDQGYAFAEDVKVMINGKELKGQITDHSGNYLNLYVEYNRLTDNSNNNPNPPAEDNNPNPPAEDNKQSDNPKTGDEFPVGAVAALMVLAITGLAVTVVCKKRMI